jgi:hypothetical protein
MNLREIFGRVGYRALVTMSGAKERLDDTLDRWVRGFEVYALQQEFGINVHDARAALDRELEFERARACCERAGELGLTVRDYIARLAIRNFPCGCVRWEVDRGHCLVYAPGELPGAHHPEIHQCRR